MTATRRLPGPVQWYGGKGQLAKRLLGLLPSGDAYCEPYGGAAALLFAREASGFEVYNDIHGDLVNLFRAIRDPERFDALARRVSLTLYAKGEFDNARETLRHSLDEDDRAWAFYTMMNQGFGGIEHAGWGRATNIAHRRLRDGVTMKVASWLSRVEHLPAWHERLRLVQIEQRDALDVIRDYDQGGMVFYIDPPYTYETRKTRGGYREDAGDAEHHEALVERLLRLEGSALLSGYDTDVYRPLERAGWRRVEMDFTARGANRGIDRKRVEVAWVKESRSGASETSP